VSRAIFSTSKTINSFQTIRIPHSLPWSFPVAVEGEPKNRSKQDESPTLGRLSPLIGPLPKMFLESDGLVFSRLRQLLSTYSRKTVPVPERSAWDYLS
jgi:hypothetical protein